MMKNISEFLTESFITSRLRRSQHVTVGRHYIVSIKVAIYSKLGGTANFDFRPDK